MSRSSSKGNQYKFERNGVWYKYDYLGYESASEFLCSFILKNSSIIDFVTYELCKDVIGPTDRVGCHSRNFLEDGETLVTADRLFKQYYGVSVSSIMDAKQFVEDKISYFVDLVEKATGIVSFGTQLTELLEWDSFVLNDDRHFNNIAFIKNNDSFRLAPCFDNGGAFLSDTTCGYPLGYNLYGLIASVRSKPFSTIFSEQMKVCQKLYGTQFKLDDSIVIPQYAWDSIELYYGKQICDRIQQVYEYQFSDTDFRTDLVNKSSVF